MASHPDNHSEATTDSVPARDPADECVIVVHGLWLHGAVMRGFCARLRKAGFQTFAFSYPSMRRTATENARALSRFITQINASRIHIVAHSLGGLISLLCAQDHEDKRLSRIVLLGSPVKGSAVADRLAGWRLGRVFLGKAGNVLSKGIGLPLPGAIEVGVVAGTMGVGLGRMVMQLRGQHDGTVQIDETRLPGAKDFIALPVTHTGMLFSARVASAVAGFLRDGRFPSTPDQQS